MKFILFLIFLPFLSGLLCIPLGRAPALCRRGACAVFAAVFVMCARLFIHRAAFPSPAEGGVFAVDALAALVCLGIGFFGLVVAVYSAGFFGGWGKSGVYYGYLLMTGGTSLAAALANNIVLLLCAWGFLGFTLYVLINLAGESAAGAAKKTMIVVGGTDAFMVLGFAIVCSLVPGRGGPFAAVIGGSAIPLHGGAAMLAYLCIAAAAFAKAGAMPFHTWIPDCAEEAPLPVTAFLPASLDKLLGIYLLARVSLHLFRMDATAQLVLMCVGAGTVVCAVMMAMVQHNMKRLLGYHAVSQVGYMVLGIGTCNPLGVAGGLFHMVNNCLYKTCLFLSAGAVEKEAGTAELDDLGGLARMMPVSFLSCLTASLAISGVPPLNGFASKWLVYQGLIEMGKGGGGLWVVWLLAAMFGSVLTLASFVKLLNATFLGQPSGALVRRGGSVREAPVSMWAPMAVLAALCLALGIFAVPLAMRFFIDPAVGGRAAVLGLWEPAPATWLMVAGILIGLGIHRLSVVAPVRESEPFIGGEPGTADMAVSGVDFYRTIMDMGILKGIYRSAGRKAFDIYDRGKAAVLCISDLLRGAHAGILPVYLGWCLAGLLALMLVLLR